jgi:hypothetical protein
MNRLILLLLAMGAGTAGYAVWNQAARQSRANLQELARQQQAASNDLARAQNALPSLGAEVRDKQDQLRAVNHHGNISPEMLAVLNHDNAPKHLKGWADLRQELGIGWDASPDYVLVRKEAIKGIWFNKLDRDGRLTGDSIQLLNLTPDEETAVAAVLDQIRVGQWLNVKNTTPAGDSAIAAQLTLVPPDPEYQAGESNAFSAGITAAIGPERAALFLKDAWREFLNDFSTLQTQVMTLRWVQQDGQPDLICEESSGGKIVSTMPVRYAHYPAFPLLKLFPHGGWQEMAQSMNFQLPPGFNPQN